MLHFNSFVFLVIKRNQICVVKRSFIRVPLRTDHRLYFLAVNLYA